MQAFTALNLPIRDPLVDTWSAIVTVNISQFNPLIGAMDPSSKDVCAVRPSEFLQAALSISPFAHCPYHSLQSSRVPFGACNCFHCTRHLLKFTPAVTFDTPFPSAYDGGTLSRIDQRRSSATRCSDQGVLQKAASTWCLHF
jgi:hypothetical protein